MNFRAAIFLGTVYVFLLGSPWNYNPGVTFLFEIVPTRFESWDVVQNTILFIPLGLAVAAALTPKPRFIVFLWTMLFGLVVSLLAEGQQLFLPSRSASLLDLAANVVGTALGAATSFAAADRLGKKKQIFFGWLYADEARIVFLGCFAFLLVRAAFPFIPWTHPANLIFAFQRFRGTPFLVEMDRPSSVDFLVFAALTLSLFSLLPRKSAGRTFAVLGTLALVAITLETLPLFLVHPNPSLVSLAADMLGILAGFALFRNAKRIRRGYTSKHFLFTLVLILPVAQSIGTPLANASGGTPKGFVSPLLPFWTDGTSLGVTHLRNYLCVGLSMVPFGYWFAREQIHTYVLAKAFVLAMSCEFIFFFRYDHFDLGRVIFSSLLAFLGARFATVLLYRPLLTTHQPT